MIQHSNSELRGRARRALARALGPDAPPQNQTSSPEYLARLEAALRSLPKQRREIFLAVSSDGLSYADLARRTGLSRQRVKREVARALMHLHQVVDDRRQPWWRRLMRR